MNSTFRLDLHNWNRFNQLTIPAWHSIDVSTRFNPFQFTFLAQDRELDDDWPVAADSSRIRKSHASSADGLTMQCRTSRKSQARLFCNALHRAPPDLLTSLSTTRSQGASVSRALYLKKIVEEVAPPCTSWHQPTTGKTARRSGTAALVDSVYIEVVYMMRTKGAARALER